MTTKSPLETVDKVIFEMMPRGQATVRTLAAMRRFVLKDMSDLELRAFVIDRLKNLRGHDFSREIETLFKIARDEIRYLRDPLKVELVQDAKRTLAFKAGDCDDKTTLLATLLGIAGHLTRFVVIGYTPFVNRFDHVFLEVYDKQQEQWISLDATNEAANVGWNFSGWHHRAKFPIFKPSWNRF